MGRSYLFECPRCAYRAPVSGGPDRGLDVATLTIVCRDCRKLYDVVTRLRLPRDARHATRLVRRAGATPHSVGAPEPPPPFEAALNRLFATGSNLEWRVFRVRCPMAALHRVEPWNANGPCPRCATHLDRAATPFRIWD